MFIKNLYFKFLAFLMGRNIESTPKEVILDQMQESRPLPLGRKEFEIWSDRIISGALIPSEPGMERELLRSLKFTLAGEIFRLAPTESHKPDMHFIHVLRKACVNQVAQTIITELNAERKAEEAMKVQETSLKVVKEVNE